MAKYLHHFNTVSGFTEAYHGESYMEPWVSYTEENEKVNFNKLSAANGHPYIDLGLPSGTLWATMNVGANSPEEYGGYYAWGEITTKERYAWDTYKWSTATEVEPWPVDGTITKYNNNDGKEQLDLEDDAANVVMGGGWHIPTEAQCRELVNNTTSAWTSDWNNTGVAGVVLTSTANTNSIFIPAGGGRANSASVRPPVNEGTYCYMGSSTCSSVSMNALIVANSSDGTLSVLYCDRSYGLNIRGVLL